MIFLTKYMIKKISLETLHAETSLTVKIYATFMNFPSVIKKKKITIHIRTYINVCTFFLYLLNFEYFVRVDLHYIFVYLVKIQLICKVQKGWDRTTVR